MSDVVKRLVMFGVGLLAGVALWFFCPKQNYNEIVVTRTRVVEKVKTQTKWKDRTVTITEPGKTTVIVEKEKTDTDVKEKEKEDYKNVLTPSLSRYSIQAGVATSLSLTPTYKVGVDARIGDLPLFLGVWGMWPKPVVGLSVRWEM
jgi:hypothetical protein